MRRVVVTGAGAICSLADSPGELQAALQEGRSGLKPVQLFSPNGMVPEEAGEVRPFEPDLIVVFGDLLWRSVGTVGGSEGVHTFENDTGPDDANHAQDGLFVAAGPGIAPGMGLDAHLLDIAPTVLELMGIATTADMRGQSLVARLKKAS